MENQRRKPKLVRSKNNFFPVLVGEDYALRLPIGGCSVISGSSIGRVIAGEAEYNISAVSVQEVIDWLYADDAQEPCNERQ